MTDVPPVTFRWTRHVEFGLSGRVMGVVLIPIGVLIAYAAGSDHAWFACAIGVFVLVLALPSTLGPRLRVKAEKECARVRPQSPPRDPQICFIAYFLGYGSFLIDRALIGDEVDTGYVVGGSVGLALGALLVWNRTRMRGDLVIGQTQIDVPPNLVFSIDDDSATMQIGYRSDDVVIRGHTDPGRKPSKTGLPFRIWGIHPNTVLSTIEQLREWNSESRVVDGRVIAAMVEVKNQKSIKRGESVDIPIDVSPRA